MEISFGLAIYNPSSKNFVNQNYSIKTIEALRPELRKLFLELGLEKYQGNLHKNLNNDTETSPKPS